MESSSETRETLIKDVDQLKGNVIQITQDAKAHAAAHVDEVRQRFNTALADVQKHLSEHPMIVLGAGLALGFLFGRRRRRRD